MRKLAEWSDARTAAIFLKPCTPRNLTEHIGPLILRRGTNRFGADSARGTGYEYARHDLERVRAIQDALGCSPLRAAQHLHALRTLGAQHVLTTLTETLEESLKRVAR